MDELEQLGSDLVNELSADAKSFVKTSLNKIADKIPQALSLAAKKTPGVVDDSVAMVLGEPLKAIAKDLIAKI